jgi:hypothetical protein
MSSHGKLAETHCSSVKMRAQKQNIVNTYIKAIFSILLNIGGMLITVVQGDTHALRYMQLNVKEAKQL